MYVSCKGEHLRLQFTACNMFVKGLSCLRTKSVPQHTDSECSIAQCVLLLLECCKALLFSDRIGDQTSMDNVLVPTGTPLVSILKVMQ